ncbi:MAG: CHAT domain-containing protein [Altererythrobacter sp.]|nr:CHAT domain-containing protein [Altererythrobacter sp.]
MAACSEAPGDPAPADQEPIGFLGESAKSAHSAGESPDLSIIVAQPESSLRQIIPKNPEWRQLIEAIAGESLFTEVLRSKEQHGRETQVRAGNEDDLLGAEKQLRAIQTRLKQLSAGGTPTYLLLHHVDSEGYLSVFLLDSENGLERATYPESYEGLDFLVEGLGVRRLASTRAPIERGQPEPTQEEIDALRAADQTPAAKAEREGSLRDAREILIPDHVFNALKERSGRILVKGARDSSTAPYAALPMGDGPAARRFSFVMLPDLRTMEDDNGIFEFDQLNLNRAVVVGNPDLSDDPKYKWHDLPGAEAEARSVASKLDNEKLLIGKAATRSALTGAIHSIDNLGMVYIASHAIADPRNPLTRGFVAMSGREGHYFAGHIRQERFRGWQQRNPLVVMSACQTALGRVLDGGGFGIARSWTTVGAGQVVSSLWNVSDNATKILMNHFLERLKAGDTPEIAMQKAQLKTMQARTRDKRQPYLDDPKMWASFSIYGKPSG